MDSYTEAVILRRLSEDDSYRARYLPVFHSQDFTTPGFSAVLQIIQGLFAGDKPISTAIVNDIAYKRRIIPAEDWTQLLYGLVDSREVEYRTTEFINETRRQQAIQALTRAVERIQAGDAIEAALGEAYEKAQSSDPSDTDSEVSAESIYDMIVDAAERRRDPESRKQLVFTQYKFLNDLTGGMEGGDLVLVSGLTGKGKTAFAGNLLKSVGIDQAIPTLLVNTEMKATQLGCRYGAMISQSSDITHHALRNGLDDDQFERLKKEAQYVRRSKLYIKTVPNLTLTSMRAIIRKYVIQYKIRFVVLDYVGRMDMLKQKAEQWEIMQAAALELKCLAMQHNLVIIMLAQLQDSGELAKSRQMEQEVDVHFRLLPMDEALKLKVVKQKQIGKIDPRFNYIVDVKKARNSPRGLCPLQFNGDKQTFSEVPSGPVSAIDYFGGREVNE